MTFPAIIHLKINNLSVQKALTLSEFYLSLFFFKKHGQILLINIASHAADGDQNVDAVLVL